MVKKNEMQFISSTIIAHHLTKDKRRWKESAGNSVHNQLLLSYNYHLICSHTLQVLIQETGDRRFLGIGAAYKGYEASHSMPGWSKGTVGYHVDDGKIFHAKNPEKGEEVEGNISRAFLAA